MSSIAFPGMRGSRPRIINRAGFFRLVMRSRKAEAVEIQDWVTREVLPAIESDGMYVNGEEKVAAQGVITERFHERIMVREFSSQMDRETRFYRASKEFNIALGRACGAIARDRGVTPATITMRDKKLTVNRTMRSGMFLNLFQEHGKTSFRNLFTGLPRTPSLLLISEPGR